MKSKSSKTIFAALVLSLFATVAAINAAAQTKQPNLSGTWKMNAEKSKFERGGPSGILLKLDHQENSLSETLTLQTDGGERSVDLKYATDGKDKEQDVMGRPTQTAVKWDGQTLVIEWRVEGQSFTRKLTVSPDGKTLTMIVNQSNSQGEASTDNILLEKQEAKK